MDYTRNYQDFPFSVEFYDYVPYTASLTDIGFFLEYAARLDGPVLDLGCGTGRVLLPLARRGHRVTGLDISQLMLRRCREKLAAEPEPIREQVRLVEASMHSFALEEKFDLIFSAFRSFQILTSLEHEFSCLRCVHEHLEDDGRLILGLFDPHLPYLIDKSRQQEWGEDAPFRLPDGRVVTLRNRNPGTDLARQIIDCELIYYVEHQDGRRERLVQAFQLRYFFRYEMEHLLARAGFELEEVFGDYDRSPFGARQPQEMVLVARKVR